MAHDRRRKKMKKGAHFDPEAIEIMKAVLDDAWAALSPSQQRALPKAHLAERILSAAANGERDPVRLLARALNSPRDTMMRMSP
jgi:hypothetical protein